MEDSASKRREQNFKWQSSRVSRAAWSHALRRFRSSDGVKAANCMDCIEPLMNGWMALNHGCEGRKQVVALSDDLLIDWSSYGIFFFFPKDIWLRN